MRIVSVPLIATTMLLSACAHEPPSPPAEGPAKLSYPMARTVDQQDEFHGVTVKDPYRWMEDLDAPELKTWIDAENDLVAEYLADVPDRESIKTRLTALYDFERYGVPQVHGGRYFYARNDGLQNQSPWYWQQGLDGEARLLAFEPQRHGKIVVADFEIVELVLENDRHARWVDREQMIGNGNAVSVGFEFDIKMMIAGRGAELFRHRQDVAHNPLQRLLGQVVIVDFNVAHAFLARFSRTATGYARACLCAPLCHRPPFARSAQARRNPDSG